MQKTQTQAFHNIGLVGKSGAKTSGRELQSLYDYLRTQAKTIWVEQEIQTTLTPSPTHVTTRDQLCSHCDVVVVVGGDGSFLTAARYLIGTHIPLIGINRGRLGFLTDIRPSELTSRLEPILHGQYCKETRLLLQGELLRPTEKPQHALIHQDCALNDIVLLPGPDSHMLDFELSINQQLVCVQRADGQIIATPTGSTAYALSGGGPILHPALQAMVLVPMFPHNLNSRPLVVEIDAVLELTLSPKHPYSAKISFDGHERITMQPGDCLRITKHPHSLCLIHPLDYNYYETLRSKLHWVTPLT